MITFKKLQMRDKFDILCLSLRASRASAHNFRPTYED